MVSETKGICTKQEYVNVAGVSIVLNGIAHGAIHGGGDTADLTFVYTSQVTEKVYMDTSSRQTYSSQGYTFTLNSINIDLNTYQSWNNLYGGCINITADTGTSCIPEGEGTLADPRNCCSGLVKDPSTGICTSPTAPAPSTTADYAIKINLKGLAWADLQGLTNYLPTVTTTFANAILVEGLLGWSVTESRIESGSLVIYLGKTAASFASMQWNYDLYDYDYYRLNYKHIYQYLQGPITAVEIGAALVTITGILLRFGFLIVGWQLINLATKVTQVYQTQADTNQMTVKTITDMCNKGELTPEQCKEALDKLKGTDWGTLILYGAGAIAGVMVLGYVLKK